MTCFCTCTPFVRGVYVRPCGVPVRFSGYSDRSCRAMASSSSSSSERSRSPCRPALSGGTAGPFSVSWMSVPLLRPFRTGAGGQSTSRRALGPCFSVVCFRARSRFKRRAVRSVAQVSPSSVRCCSCGPRSYEHSEYNGRCPRLSRFAHAFFLRLEVSLLRPARVNDLLLCRPRTDFAPCWFVLFCCLPCLQP